jgi:hypothetical protein
MGRQSLAFVNLYQNRLRERAALRVSMGRQSLALINLCIRLVVLNYVLQNSFNGPIKSRPHQPLTERASGFDVRVSMGR